MMLRILITQLILSLLFQLDGNTQTVFSVNIRPLVSFMGKVPLQLEISNSEKGSTFLDIESHYRFKKDYGLMATYFGTYQDKYTGIGIGIGKSFKLQSSRDWRFISRLSYAYLNMDANFYDGGMSGSSYAYEYVMDFMVQRIRLKLSLSKYYTTSKAFLNKMDIGADLYLSNIDGHYLRYNRKPSDEIWSEGAPEIGSSTLGHKAGWNIGWMLHLDYWIGKSWIRPAKKQ